MLKRAKTPGSLIGQLVHFFFSYYIYVAYVCISVFLDGFTTNNINLTFYFPKHAIVSMFSCLYSFLLLLTCVTAKKKRGIVIVKQTA